MDVHISGFLAKTKKIAVQLGLPDLSYFMGDPVFQTPFTASHKEAARKN